MSRLDDAFSRLGEAMVPGATTWREQWEHKLAELNDAATYPRVACDIADCVICEMGVPA